MFWNVDTGLEMIVHVDDLLVTGEEKEIKRLEARLMSKYELKSKVIGPGAHQEKEGENLGMRIRFEEGGLSISADSKHGEVLLKDNGMEQCRGATVPYVTEKGGVEVLSQKERELMNSSDARGYRGSVARVVYLAQDRVDLGHSGCLVARTMARPRKATQGHVMKKIRRHLKEFPEYSQFYPDQEKEGILKLYIDSDWATCKMTRRSCSGGLVMMGSHVIHHWCRLQDRIALSSGEAELYSGVRGISEVLNLYELIKEWEPKVDLKIEHRIDAEACKGVLLRHGVGQLKHLETKVLWVQENIKNYLIKVIKVPRTENPSDVLASPSDTQSFGRFLKWIGARRG